MENFDLAIKRKRNFPTRISIAARCSPSSAVDEEAVESCRKALAIAPNNPEAHYNLGNSLRRLGRNDEALKSFDRALALRPNYANALNNRGMVLQDAEAARRRRWRATTALSR